MDRSTIRAALRAPAGGHFVATCSMLLLFTACSGGGGGGGPSITATEDVPESQEDAARFLMQATFGPTEDDIALLMPNGFTGWLEWQRTLQPSLQRAKLESMSGDVYQNQRLELWWKHAIRGEDQLRQRVAWALSQIFVISDQAGPLQNDVYGCAEYYDILTRNALGDYRQLLEEVTLSPQMGKYLSHLKNRKADPLLNIRPDENYAREVMQLFTIGLVALNPDGTVQLDEDDLPIPTYDQEVVEGFARVFTGWNYADATSWNWPQANYRPMEAWPNYHETGEKVILDGHLIAPGQTAEQDLERALDVLANHPNVGPFISRQLIQRLVTSNPQPAYVGRVAAVFADDGSGTRGNLYAVVKAILLDDEARNGHELDPERFGKLKEPIMRQANLWRAFEARASSNRYREWNPESSWGQAPLRAASVFNFYSPFYRPPGEMLDQGLYGPEFQITTHTLITSGTNKLNSLVYWGYQGNPSADGNTVKIMIAPWTSLASDPEALVDKLDLLLMAGSMSSAMRTQVVGLVQDTSLADGGTDRVQEAIWLIASSPEGAVQK